MLMVSQLVGFGAAKITPAFNVYDTITSVVGSNQTSHAVSLPTVVRNGDLLVAIFSKNGNSGTITWGTFTKIRDVVGTTVTSLSIAYKTADGTESGGTETVTTSESITSQHIVLLIRGNKNTALQVPEASAGATASTGSANPDNLIPAGGSQNYLWIACAGTDSSGQPSAGPSGYPNFLANNTAQDDVAVAWKFTTASSEDPGTFTNTSTGWVACTVAVYPA